MCNPVTEIGKFIGTEVDTPPVPSYESQMRDAITAQENVMPQLFAAEQYWQPKWDQLALERANRYLGTEDQPGMLDTYATLGQRMGTIESDMASAQRGRDIGDVRTLGPQAYEAMRGYNPQQTALMDALNQQALQQTQLGGRMTPDQQAMIQNSVMGRRSSQGWGYNPGDMAEAVRQASGYGDQLAQARMAQGQRQAGMNQNIYGDPFLQILGRPGQAFSAIPGASVMAQQGMQGAGNQFMQPESQMAFDIWNTGYQGQLGANIAGANNRAAITGAALGATGSMGGGMMQGAGAAGGLGAFFCWVARSTFGADDIRWLQFRRWLLTCSPRWFQALYFWAGPTVSAWLDRKGPVARRVRPWIKRWMQARIDSMTLNHQPSTLIQHNA